MSKIKRIFKEESKFYARIKNLKLQPPEVIDKIINEAIDSDEQKKEKVYGKKNEHV